MTWNIRRMNESDIENVYAIETSVHIAPWSKNILRDCVLVGYNCLVLETQIENIWMLGGYIICRHNNRTCHILNYCIAKHLQSQGYGRKFLQHVLDSLIQIKDIDQVILEVRPSNSIALHLYDTLGFKQMEVKQGYYNDNNKVEDAILLKKILHTSSKN
jgi:ribosomal-protein-alanine N-acetyltransferase